MKQHNLKNLQQLKLLNKKDTKAYINKHGGFIKFECKSSTTDLSKIPSEFDVPKGMTYVEGVISTQDLNMNGYKIALSVWTDEVLEDFMETWNGLMYYQHDMDDVIGKTLRVGVVGEELQIKAYLDDSLIGNRFANGLSRDFSTGHYNLEVMYEKNEDSSRISETDFKVLEKEVRDESKTWEDLEDSLAILYSERTMIVTDLVFVEYSLVTVGANRKSSVKKYKKNTNSINGILSHKGYNSLSNYISEMKTKHVNLSDAKKILTNSTDSEEVSKVEDVKEEVEEIKEETTKEVVEVKEPTEVVEEVTEEVTEKVEESIDDIDDSEEKVLSSNEEVNETIEEGSDEGSKEVTDGGDREVTETEETNNDESIDKPETKQEESIKQDDGSEGSDDVIEEDKEVIVDTNSTKQDNQFERDNSLQSMITEKIELKLGIDDDSTSDHIWIMDIFPADVIYNYWISGPNGTDKYYRISYSIIDGEVELTDEPVEVESKTEWVDKSDNMRKKLNLSIESNTDDDKSEKEGEKPEVKEDNSLGTQTKEDNIILLSNALKESNASLTTAYETIKEMNETIVSQNSVIEQAKEITIKNGIFGKEESDVGEEKSYLHKKLDNIVN